MKNIETPSKKHLNAIISDLNTGAYVIPDFQREFEWGPGDVNELIRSIFEDFYIGTVLLWRATKDNLSFLKCEPIYGYSGRSNPQHIVLDGQQRLSALHYALFAPDKHFPRRQSRYYFFIDIAKLLEKDYEQAFIYHYGPQAAAKVNDREGLFSQRWFPLRVFGENPHAWYKWLEEYEEYWKEKGETKATAERKELEVIFSDLLQSYYVSYIELDREIPVEKVCDIFTRINTTGVELDIFDLLNALLRPKDINLKERWRLVKDKFSLLPKPDAGKLIVLQTISILKQEYCAPKFLYYLVPQTKKKIREKDGKMHEQVLVRNKEAFDELWEQSVERNLASLKKLANPKDFGAIVPKFLPYPTMLPIFTVLNIEKEKPEYKNKKSLEEKIRAWYWASIFTTNYSSSVESQMSQDYREMRRWFADDKKVPIVIKKFRRAIEAPDFFEKLKSGSAVYRGIFCLIVRCGAKDFYNWELPEYSQLDDHHIVPKSWGRRNSPDLVDSILNRTPISDETNRNIIRDRLPNEYIQEMIEKNGKEAVYQLFETHLVPREAVDILLRKSFKANDLEAYTDLRKNAIRQTILGLLKDIHVEDTDIEDVDLEENTIVEEFLLEPSTLLFCKSKDADARANPGRGNKLRVLKGSVVAKDVKPSFGKHHYHELREYLLKEKVLVEQREKLVFSDDYEFSSPSAAASIVLGRSADGQTVWKDSEGKAIYTMKFPKE